MSIIFIGLGNPGKEFENTRHNAGRMILERAAKSWEADDWKLDKKLSALKTSAKVGKKSVMMILPETFMNLSGKSVKPLVTSVKKATDLVVLQDEMDLPIGTFKISFNRGSGGHKGVESIIKSIKTPAFTRVRIGVSPHTPSGKIKKVNGDGKVINFIVGPFKPAELDEFKKVSKKIIEALEVIIEEGKDRAMNQFN